MGKRRAREIREVGMEINDFELSLFLISFTFNFQIY